MSKRSKKFQSESRRVAFDLQHRKTIRFNMSRYDAAVAKGKARYANLELAKERASFIREKVLQNFDSYLLQFEENVTRNGAKVIWAKDGYEAIAEIVRIIVENRVKLVVKSKSMTTEEIQFNESMNTILIESVETDLGEYIVQVAGEKPYHIVTPAMHKSKEDVAKLFHEKFNTPPGSTPEELTDFVRRKLREKYQAAELGVTGANFLVADIGAVSVTENEGNALMSTSFPRIHIVIAGIEKIIPKLNDLSLLLPLLAVHGTGQQISAYNTLFTGPRREGENDGPEKMYVILLDNERSSLFDKDDQFASLKCIRCGACLNNCPVYRNIGGYTYDSTYSGPIGSVITPHLNGMKEYKHLSFASSLCGKCTESCPVKIELHRLLLYNRRDAVKAGFSPMTEKIAMQAFKTAMLRRCLMDAGNPKLRNLAVTSAGSKLWGSNRDFPVLQESFSKQWKKNLKI
ncbi:MAG: LutB/LldF family L-lactate oxidation iron-sulfur protein [Bacteroidia bacterium]|nr:LutB/LldF family L-lactate oxidation iron-sulfur protein [Bacteroidia bacterium]